MGLGTTQDKHVSEIISHFTNRQVEATEAVFAHDYVLYGGARGGGKSHWLRWMMLILLLYWYWVRGLRNVHVAIFCEDYPSLTDRQISKIGTEFPAWLGELKSTQTDGLGFYLNEANGGGVILLRNLDKPAKYQSTEFAAIGIDQLEKNLVDKFDILRGSKRWPEINHTKFIGTANPGSIGHAWVKRYWIDGDLPTELIPLKKEFVFVKSLPEDNPYLSEQYWIDLNTLPSELRRAWVLGDWNVFKGQAFTEFRTELHVVPAHPIPSYWPRWRAIDWGYAKPFCCLWGSKDPDTGRKIVYRELYQDLLTDKQQARAIIELTGKDEKILRTFADPSMWERKEDDNQITTTAKRYQDEGVPLTKANNDRLGGKRKVHAVLANLPDGKPGIEIFENCDNLIRTIPMLPYDPVQVEDVDTKAEDHAYDTLRYLLSDMEIVTAAPARRKQASPLQQAEGIV